MASEKHLDLAMGIFSILFVSSGSVSLRHIRAALNLPEEDLKEAVAVLNEIISKHTPLFVQEIEQSIKLKTRPEYEEYVKAIVDTRKQSIKLTEESLFTLTIIAYKQPIKKSQIDKLRGVDSEKTLDTLEKHDMIKPLSGLKEPGAPILYVTTKKFLEHFGLKNLSDLPLPENFNSSKNQLDNVLQE